MVRTNRVVPKEWTKYNALGSVIPKTRFVVFKSPLNEQLLTKLPKSQHFTTFHLFRMLAERGMKLGLVVDLTDTTRYYDKKEFEGMCIQYEKIFCAGRGFVDREEIPEQFNNAIERFIANNDDKELLIGVHCTHGVNRSGYLICRFLIERLGWSSHEAILAFEQARGYPIEKGAYIQALHRAWKDARNKKLASDGSDDSEVRRKKKKKEKRKTRDDNETQDMIQQFLGQLGQHSQAIEMGLETGSPATDSPAVYDSPAEQAWPAGAGSQVPGASDEQNAVLDEGSPCEGSEGADTADNGPEELSKNQRRRMRKRKHEEMLRVMKRGNFHEIHEMINARFGDG